MELRQLQYFVKVARKLHVTQAAYELHVAQSAVSRQIHQLEEELGVNLFLIKGRSLYLTPAGKLFLARAEEILELLERAVNEVHELLDPEVGEIRIGFPHSLGIHLIPSIVARFRQDHPKARFRLKQGRSETLMKDVIYGEIDLAFISPFVENGDQVIGEMLWKEELFAILPPQHPLAESPSIRLAQLKNEPFALFSEGYSLRQIVLEACAKAGFSPKISFEGEETDTIRGLVAAGIAVSLLPEISLTDTGNFQPVKVKIIEPQVTRTIGLIRRAGEKLPKVAEAFHQFLREYFQLK